MLVRTHAAKPRNRSALNSLVSAYLAESRSTIYLAGSRSGTITDCNNAFKSLVQPILPDPTGAAVWAVLTDAASMTLREVIEHSGDHVDQRILLTFKHSGLFECTIDVQPDGFALVGEAQLNGRLPQMKSHLALAAREFSRKTRALAETEAQYVRIAELISGIIFINKANGSVDYVSPQWYALTGAGPGAAEGDGWLDYIHPDDRPRLLRAQQTSLQELRRLELELRMRLADGTYHWFFCRSLPLTDREDRGMQWLGALIDIDAQKKNEQSLEMLTAQLREKNQDLMRSNQDLEQFAYAASHDLQEPLRSVSMFVQLLARKHADELDEDAHKLIEHASDGAKQMSKIISDLLTYSRLATSQAPPSRPVDLNVVLQWTLMNLATRIHENEAEITSDRLPTVAGDQSQMIQLFHNLLGNALKHRGPKAPRIHVSAAEHADGWVVSVADNGIGFPQEYADQIFGVFKRLQGKDVPGTGIGLAIVKRIVERHGGRVWATSEPDRGSAFSFTIPREL